MNAATDTTPSPIKADRRAFARGASDHRINNVNPDFSGDVIINGEQLQVISSAVFNGVLHWGILGKLNGENIVGWVPAALCEIVQ